MKGLLRSLRPFLAELFKSPASEAELTESLYQRWFIDWDPPHQVGAQASGDERVVAELTRLAGSSNWLAPGWTVTGRFGAAAFVSDEQVQLYVDAGTELSPKNPAVGTRVRLRLPCARGCATPGFFLLVSRRGRAPQLHHKLYLHLTAAGGGAVIQTLGRLDACFEVKVANAKDAYGRRDSGIVYVQPEHVSRVVRALRPLTAQPRLFRDQVPPMTHRLGRGLAIAEPDWIDSQTPTSFGEDRCRLVARALLRAHRRGSRALEPHLSECLREAGVDPAAPWKRASVV